MREVIAVCHIQKTSYQWEVFCFVCVAIVYIVAICVAIVLLSKKSTHEVELFANYSLSPITYVPLKSKTNYLQY